LASRFCSFAALLVLPLLPLQAAYDIPALERVEAQVYAVVEKAMPCVVSLSRTENLGLSQGSGIIISRNGLVLTAAHVVGDSKIVNVTFPDQKRVQAKVLGADYGRDIALAIITAPDDFPFLELGNPQDLAIGDMVVALGHPGGFDPQRKPPVRLGRVFEFSQEAFIRTDCTVVGGDSGGPLLDLNGKVIGVHSSVGVDLSWNNHAPIAAVRQDWDRMIKGDRWGRLQQPAAPRLSQAELNGLDLNKFRQLIARESMANKGKVTLKSEEIAKRLIDCGMNEEAVKAMSGPALASFMQKALGGSGKVTRGNRSGPGDASPDDAAPIGEAFAGLDVDKLRELLIARSSEDDGRLAVKTEDMKKWLQECGMTEEASAKITAEDFGKLVKKVLGVAGVRKPGKQDEIISRQDQEILLAVKPNVDSIAPSMVALKDGNKVLAVGTVVRENGFILTKHSDLVKARTLTAELADGRSLPAVLVKHFEEHDLALVKIDAGQLPFVLIPGHENGLHLGSMLITPGASLETPILGQGIMSVLERDLREGGGYLGIGLNEVEGAVEANSVLPFGPAAKAGLQKNDRILAIDGTSFQTAQALSDHIRTLPPNSVVELKYRRGTEEKTAEVTVGDRAKFRQDNKKLHPLATLGTDVSERKGGFAMVFQHDQTLRPQDCGGVLLDLHGNIVGVNIARVGRVASYAVPARLVSELLEQEDFQQLEEKAAQLLSTPKGS
jgi:S1-C subfamily serine protease